MTELLSGGDIARQIGERLPDAVSASDESMVLLKGEALLEVARFLKDDLGFDCLNSITAVDHPEYFELVYQLTSIKNNRSLVLKVRCAKEGTGGVPSVVNLWQGADLQEREIYDLFGISFQGHPNLKRIFLWDGFQGHPLRKDFVLDVPGGGLKERSK
jgi:NADH-quinone oxidoreductase subunit C